jgi:hypothetical protein
MDLEVIATIFTFGKFLALTPSSMNNHNPHCLQKFYEICVVYLLQVTGFFANIYASCVVYQNLASMQLVLAILSDLIHFSYVFYILIVMMRVRRSRWFRLIKSLAAVQSAPKTIPLKLIFVASQLVYYCLTAFGAYADIDRASLTVAAFNMGVFYHFYAMFFYLVCESILLILLHSRYEGVSESLSQLIKGRSQLHSKQIVEILKKIKKSVLTLKEGVEVFNDIFGWSILFTIFSCVNRTLVYIDVVIKHSDLWLGPHVLVLYHDVFRILTSWVRQFTCPFCTITPF